MKTIKKDNNKAGTEYRLMKLDNGNYLVYKRSLNYSAHTKGGMRESYGYVTPRQRMSFTESSKYAREGDSFENAKKIFDKKIAGKQK